MVYFLNNTYKNGCGLIKWINVIPIFVSWGLPVNPYSSTNIEPYRRYRIIRLLYHTTSEKRPIALVYELHFREIPDIFRKKALSAI